MAVPLLRFAPSPTGYLHVGNARVALINWLFARQSEGRMLLRLDDTDAERSRADFAEAIEEDLLWLGLDWDFLVRQSDRLDRYDVAAKRLRAQGRLYPCYETDEELDLKRKLQLKQGRPPIYDRAALSLGDEERSKLDAEGRRPHWRFLLEDAPIVWEDMVRGEVRFAGNHLSDPVLIREDGRPLYTLSSVVDDIELDVTHVIRGEDHVANTAVQVQLIQALGAEVPTFGHLPLLTDRQGKGLSKREGASSLRDLRDREIEPMTLNSYLARLGTPDPVKPCRALKELVAGFDITRFGRAAPKFDPDELHHLNAAILHDTPYSDVAERLWALGLQAADEAFWLAVRPNLTRLSDAVEWHRICHSTVTPDIDEPDYCRQAAELLPEEPFDDTTWKTWTSRVKEATGRKGKQLFLPLRRALTGASSGPELGALLPLIGRRRAEARLHGERA
jgi:glutamyl-tRNA synthetase